MRLVECPTNHFSFPFLFVAGLVSGENRKKLISVSCATTFTVELFTESSCKVASSGEVGEFEAGFIALLAAAASVGM